MQQTFPAENQSASTALAEPPINLPAALARLDGDEELFAMLITVFRQDCRNLLQELASAAARGDLRETERAAHSLKGLAANFEATAARDAALAIEQSARAGNCALVPPAIRELEAHLTRLSEALNAWTFS
jgi:HPt (histidine-containing phosphotransfer) domain-containing protein